MLDAGWFWHTDLKPDEVWLTVVDKQHLTLGEFGRYIPSPVYSTYKKNYMIRISRDIWDLKEDIEISLDRWEKMLPYADKGLWLDLDMMPFGHLLVRSSHNQKQA